MRKLKVKVGDEEFEACIKRINRTYYKVILNDKTFNISLREPGVILPKKVEKKEKSKVEVVEGEAVKAMLPGVVTKIIVKEGESVRKGDTIMILEAMKMENEVKSPKDGVVKQIVVREGDRVEVGDILAVIS
ncbi:biotin/lipoyl-containing protein [Archaeoglobus profundus]|uniref:Biotin/lipoyl attachment domain-containing protein n=1 Tax=Archaeoglobus profundus (strain DSM 5631 / JCM 9629 / NBRC 100127 / Av18) TaxID=572546 RepID=D2REN7_ARCPA|nr:biotin/lipoyl-containing protein [Archaeoglobus profundus]ADB58581.1 biotin/lipoyl attachment domain-containing protein [Archaeoglobus profundus DSM 5631]